MTPRNGAKTDATRERAILAVLSEPTLGAAARKAGLGQRTLGRWMAEDKAFQAHLATARAAAFDAAMIRVQSLMVRALDALEELLGAKEYPSVRLGAARTVAELAIHQHDAAAILLRVDELERRTHSRR